MDHIVHEITFSDKSDPFKQSVGRIIPAVRIQIDLVQVQLAKAILHQQPGSRSSDSPVLIARFSHTDIKLRLVMDVVDG